MKKSILTLISLVILFSLINIGLAQAGCVTIKVAYNGGCPRNNADIRTIKAPHDPQIRYICTTGEDGQCSRCNYLEQGDYKIQAWYNAAQFGPDTFLGVDGNGDGSQTITNTGSIYPNGTEFCGSGSCNNSKYCYSGNPPYVQCGSWNQDCDTKKCCSCNGGTITNPLENYDPNQNSDCDPFDIATCNNTPDDYPFTWDFRDSVCTGIDTCTQDIITHTCNKQTCGADCSQASDCSEECVDKKWYSDYSCNLGTCGCELNNPVCNADHCSAECGSDGDCSSGETCNLNSCICEDVTPPNITILSPENKVYYKTNVLLNFTADEELDWEGYSLDSQPVVTVHSAFNLTDLADGYHVISAFANDTSGNTGYSETNFFYCRGDITQDKSLDIFDIVSIATIYSSVKGDAKWDEKVDLNYDGIIDIFDLVMVATGFGKRC